MGNNRNLIILAAVLVALGCLYVFNSGRRSHIDRSGGFVDLVEGQLSTDEVFGLTVAKGEEVLEVVRRGDDWVVTSRFDAPANLNKLRSLLGALEDVEGEFRSDDESVLPDYALDDSTAYHLTLRDESGSAMVELLLGQRSGNGCFVRRPGQTKVYLADHNFLSDFGIWGDERKPVDPKSWVDLQAFTLKGDDVRRIEIDGSTKLTMEKEFAEAAADSAAPPSPQTYEWRVTRPANFLATRTKAESILSSLSSMRATDVVARGEIPEGAGLGDEADVVRIYGEEGILATLRIGSKVADNTAARYFQVEGEDLVWALPEYIAKNILKSADDLRPE